jgi:Mg-chelatase subunit ChlD
MTDGTPSNGENTQTAAILSWVHDFNRFAKTELHVIAMGSLGIDLDFLRRLATENGGVFIHVPDRR